ncbi:MAG: argininosuccinate synthase [Spirochaetota bacterium]|nr:argininosuccinate synthase [Spirochaetota bacterium]
MRKKVKKVVLAYSGGLDTSVILKWLIETYNAEVIAYAADIGQDEELDGLNEKAIKTGASKVYIEDLTKEFVEDYIFRAIKANAIYEGKYLLGTSLARPLIAKRQIEIAEKEGADAVAHGATGKGNDQVRFELAFKALNPKITIIAPWREWNLGSREELVKFAKSHGIPIPVTQEKPYSCDRNMMHISFEGGILEDPYAEPDDEMFVLSKSPEKAKDEVTYIEIAFDKGIPVAINGKNLSSVEIMKKLNKIAGENGVGRVDIVENRLVGMKSRGVYETPGGTILIEAHRALESITIERDTFHYKEMVALKYAELIYNGLWFHPLKESLDAFIDCTQKTVTGDVKVKLYKGNCMVVGRKSIYSLYNPALSTFERDEVYNQKDATGFINLFSLPTMESAKQKLKMD